MIYNAITGLYINTVKSENKILILSNFNDKFNVEIYKLM